MTVSVRVEGLNALVRDLEAAGVELEDLKDVFADVAERGARFASSFAPKKTGRLARSVRGNRAKNKAVVTAGNRRSVAYAQVVNYGWPARGIAASSFMQRADAVVQDYAIKRLDKGINKLIKDKGLQ